MFGQFSIRARARDYQRLCHHRIDRDPVVITGTGYGATQAGSVVLLNGTPTTINFWSSTSISITIPAGATSGPLVVSAAPGMNDSNPVTFTVTSQPLPSSWLDQDVGSVGVAGSVSFSNGTFTVQAAGAQIYGTVDAFHYVYQPLLGTGRSSREWSVCRRLRLRHCRSDDPRNAQPQLRKCQDSRLDSLRRDLFDVRATTRREHFRARRCECHAALLDESDKERQHLQQLRVLGRSELGAVGGKPIHHTMAQSVYVGLAVNSGSNSALATATFDNVSIH